MPASTQNVSQHVMTKPLPSLREESKCISTWVVQTIFMLERTQNASQHVLTKPLPENESQHVWTKHLQCQRGHKMSKHVLTKPIPCQRRQKMYLKICGPNPSHSSEDTKCISTCADQTTLMPVRTQNVYQLVFTKPLLCRRGNKIYLNMCSPYTSHAIEDIKCIST